MKTEALKEKIREYPLVVVSLVVMAAAAGVLYVNDGNGDALQDEKTAKEAELAAIKSNELYSKALPAHVERAKAVYQKIKDRAVDLDSMIDSQAFFADLIQKSGYVKIEGLPTQQALPSVNQEIKPFATCGYLLHATGDYSSLARLVRDVGENPKHSMSVTRVQLVAPDATKQKGDSVEADIVFQLWGKKGDFAPIAAGKEKKVPATVARAKTLDAAEKLLGESNTQWSGVPSLFGQGSSVAVAPGGDGTLDAALAKLNFSIIEFAGKPAVKIDGIGIKRVNTDFDVKAEGRAQRVRIVRIDEGSFTVVTPFGKKVTLVQKK